MQFDDENKTLDISVREIAFSARTSNGERYISRRLRARIGHEAHAQYQNDTKGHTEYYVKFSEKIDCWQVTIRGRVDVVHKKGKTVHLEEIKSTTSAIDGLEEDEAYQLQLQLYCYYFYTYEGYHEITADLIMIDPVNKEQRRIPIKPVPMNEFLIQFLGKIIEEHQADQHRREKLKARVSTISFPYASYRKYQEEIMDKITDGLPSKRRIMLHAPPGIGKTMTTLFPGLKYAVGEGKRLFVITSKTTQQLIYTDTIKKLQEAGSVFKAIKITAKGKVCHTERYGCEDNDCPFLEHYFQIDPSPIISGLLQLDLVEDEPIRSQARIHNICPFELSLDVAMECDLILSDFNYIFHPRVRFQRFRAEFENSILIVDEAHNLVDRAADFYSDAMSIGEIRKVMSFLDQGAYPTQVNYRIKKELKRLLRNIQQLKDQIVSLEIESSLVNIDQVFFQQIQDQLDELLILYINALPEQPKKKDPLIKFSDHLKFFTLLLTSSKNPEFEEIFDLDTRQVRILCKSAAKLLEEQMSEFDAVIVQSATLEPLQYYQYMLGLPEDSLILNYPSPFPQKNRLYLIDPSISTTYKERDQFMKDLTQLVKQVYELKHGNYLVFFSSFEYLNQIAALLTPMLSNTLLVQKSNMKDQERERMLRQLRTGSSSILLAVMGGVFSEGVDYIGDMAHGAIIVGPGLPALSFDQELKRAYFDTEYGRGFDFAYRYPGMSKVIQAAGRVFRSEHDRGFVLFVGHRFAKEEYYSLLPKDYETIVGDVLDRITDFWGVSQPDSTKFS